MNSHINDEETDKADEIVEESTLTLSSKAEDFEARDLRFLDEMFAPICVVDLSSVKLG